MKFTDKQWNLINKIILTIHQVDDTVEMRKNVLILFSALIDFDAASTYVSEGTNMFGSPVGMGISREELEDYARKYAPLDPYNDLMRALGTDQKAIRSTDYNVLFEQLDDTEYSRTLWEPKKLKFAILLPLFVKEQWLGSVNLFRREDKGDFTDEEMEIANIIREHMQIRFWREYSYGIRKESTEAQVVGAEESRISELSGGYGLTERERDVIRLWVQGFTDIEICEQLSISKNTLKKHISNIFGKLEIGSRVELLKLLH